MAKVSDDDKKAIELLFKQGMDAAMKNPKKFWADQNARDAKMKPSSKLKGPLLKLPSHKRESVTSAMQALLADLPGDTK